MGFLRTAIAVTGWGSLGGAATYTFWTRNSKMYPIAPNDYIFNTTLFARYNPNRNPVTQDICIRKVPISQVRPELLQNEGTLVESFCAGVWGGLGYAYQRRYLEKKYRNKDTESQLWDRKDLKSNTYEVGTQITDHFEVVSKNSESIIVRCGDSPRIQEARASDGLFEMLVNVKEDEGVVEFGLKSVFYNGIATLDKSSPGPMKPHIQWLHAQYDKIWMETAIRNCMK